jgi:cytochrome c553
MNVAIVLAGLTPRAKQIDGIGFGGKPVWDFADRVGLLKGLKGPALDWAYYRYCGHDAKLLPVLRYLQASIDLFCGLRRYRLRRETRAGLVEVALQEYLSPVCNICDGSGQVHTGRHQMASGMDCRQPITEECPNCHGAGRKRLSQRAIADLCGINHKSFGDSHHAVIAEGARLIASLDDAICKRAISNER